MQRIDTFLVEHQLAESREQAKRLILAGSVTVNGDSMIKPGQRVPADVKVVVRAQQKYVSRGGFKLEKALSTFGVNVRDRVALDVGASTGGFTDCLLQHGAKFVYAVDVGYGQLAWKLRTHPQVLPIEKMNIRHLTLSHLENRKPQTANREAQHGMECRKKGRRGVPQSSNLPIFQSSVKKISVAVLDVSFISLRTVLPSVVNLLTQQNGGQRSAVSGQLDIIALLKPQFEAGKAHVKKGGVVSAKRVHIETIDNLSVFVSQKLGATLMGLTYSPIHKDIANIEYLLWFTVDPNAQADMRVPNQTTVEIVEAAHQQKQ